MNTLIKHTLFWLSVIFMLACNNKMQPIPTKQDVLELQNSEPEPESFNYFMPGFKLEAKKSQLQTDGLYFRIADEDTFGDLYNFLRFYPDGLVIEYQVYNTPDKVLQLKKSAPGNIHGYYNLQGDSLFYSTKVYYNHDPKLFNGKIFRDSIKVTGPYEDKEDAERTFYFYEKQEK